MTAANSFGNVSRQPGPRGDISTGTDHCSEWSNSSYHAHRPVQRPNQPTIFLSADEPMGRSVAWHNNQWISIRCVDLKRIDHNGR
jgi:hypothetical protein